MEFDIEVLDKFVDNLEGCSFKLGHHQWNYQVIVDFPNGYSASIIEGPSTYGVELAVIHDGYIIYDTPITDDVVGHIGSEEELLCILVAIKALPKRGFKA